MCGYSCLCIHCYEESINNLTGSPMFICEDFQVVMIGLEPSHGASNIYQSFLLGWFISLEKSVLTFCLGDIRLAARVPFFF